MLVKLAEEHRLGLCGLVCASLVAWFGPLFVVSENNLYNDHYFPLDDDCCVHFWCLPSAFCTSVYRPTFAVSLFTRIS